MKKLRKLGIILAALLIATLSIREAKAVNIPELVQETQRFEEQDDRFIFIWWIPLGSLLPPKYDSETGEKFPGNYNYNPFTGIRLNLRE